MARNSTRSAGGAAARLGALAAAAALALGACAPTVSPPARPAQQAAPPPAAAPAPGPQDGRTRVALLLPLSGPSSGLGTAMLDAAQLAVFGVADDGFVLLPRDTRGSPEGAAAAAREALAEGSRLILGPFFSRSVAAAAPVAAGRAPMIAFTSDRSVARDGVWVFGFDPAEQVRRVAGYAAAQGLRRTALLVPVGAYGDVVEQALRDAALRSGSEVVRVARFEPGAGDLRMPLSELLGAGGAVGPGVEQALARGEYGFDSVLIAASGQRMREIASVLAALGFSPERAQVLGTGEWDDPAMWREPLLQGAWYAASSPAGRRDFERRYEQVYGRAPPRVASLAYDATQLAAVLARGGPQALGFGRAVLTDQDGFDGVDGIFRLTPSGAVDRGLAVLRIGPAGPEVLDPAPRDFAPRIN